jgi:acetyl esterase
MRTFVFLISFVSFICLVPLHLRATGPDSVVYKTLDTIDLKLFIYTPGEMPEDKLYPAVIFFFGGGWENGNVGQFAAHCRHLAEKGVIGITAQYRIKSKHNSTPQDAMEDAKSAVRWVREHAEEYRIDPSRIAAGGGSAGGHLAACTGLVPGFENELENLEVSSRPDAMILFNPVVEIPPLSDRFGGDEQGMKASPLNFVGENVPPCIIFHGTHDTLIDKDQILEFQKVMKENGNYCEVVLFGDQGHGFFNTNRSEGRYYKMTVALMDVFLTELGYISK